MVPTHPPIAPLLPASYDDIAALAGLAKDPTVAPFLAIGAGDDDTLRRLLSDRAHERPQGLFVVRSQVGESIGGLALRIVNERSRICELSRVMIRPDKRRLGIASAAITMACRKVLVEHSFHRIQLEVYGDNLAARALFAKLGFVCEGIRRCAYWRRERWLDGVQFGMLAEEFDRQTP
jgi:RimJ/RimL family protein N-acetyltransferase